MDLGFLQCTSSQDKVKFYEATTKVFSGDAEIVVQLNQQIKTKKRLYGGRYKRYHGITFKAEIIKWGCLPKKWDKIKYANGTRFYYLKEDNITFIRCKGKWDDTLKMHMTDILCHQIESNPKKKIHHEARIAMGKFQNRYNLRLRGFVECEGTKVAIAIRDPELVKLVQQKTIVYDNGCESDNSHGQPEFEGPPDIMDELFSLIPRVAKLEQELLILTKAITTLIPQVEKLSPEIQKLSKQVDDMMKLFSQPKPKDEFRDVT
jgi:hypothetical protein